MNNFIINTDEATEIYLDSNCYTCGSCGDLWCGCWGDCPVLQCKYGYNILERYEEEKVQSNNWYLMLVELGIENPFNIDLDRIKQLANISAWNYVPQGNIKDVIFHHYNKLKDVEEEL